MPVLRVVLSLGQEPRLDEEGGADRAFGGDYVRTPLVFCRLVSWLPVIHNDA